MIAHQYTDGQGYGNGLPEGYGTVRCDMNAADGYNPEQTARRHRNRPGGTITRPTN